MLGYVVSNHILLSVACYSVAQLGLTLWNPMDHSTPHFPILHCLPEFAQAHVHWVSDAIQPSYPLSSPFPPTIQSFPASGSFSMSQLFASGGQSIGASASVLPTNKHSGMISFRIDWFDLLAVQGTLKSLLHTTVQKHQFFSTQPSSQSNSHIHTWPQEKP